MFSIHKIGVVVAIFFVFVLAFHGWLVPESAVASPSNDQEISLAKRENPYQQDYSPMKDDFVLRNPFVSDPVSPADTTGLPPAPAVQPHDLSEESIWVIPNAFPHPEIEERISGSTSADPALQSQLGEVSMPSPITNFEGLNNTTGVLPPDTDGQIGRNHYVQIVNSTVVGIYNKSTGALMYPAFLLNNLWPGGDPCNNPNRGDPIVLYDQIADRWLLTQFYFPLSGSNPAPPYYECIAVSKTGTPTNTPSDWWLYTFLVHNTKMNDYPKLAIWPDGYYMSANQFDPGWAGTGVWVFERDAMLTGAAATFQYFDIGYWWSLLPSNLMGDTLPPSGAPNYFVSVDQDWSGFDDILHIFEFHTDWVTPANSTFSRVADLVVDPFDYDLCIATREQCIDQPDSAPELEALSYRVMMHLWYQNFGSHESLVVNHTVDADGTGRAGIRWYEIRGGTVNTTLADAVIYQQGTYAPDDGLHRWMGSIAMDQDGNIALGYSVSSTAVYPSIRYAGRLVTDPLGTLQQAEAEIIAGSGVQTHSAARWGDYSAMSVDPIADCTFWYTQEYIQTSGSALWRTRIASFKFAACYTFDDVASSHWAWNFVEGLYDAGITSGCSTDPLMYCPVASVDRAQMALFLERGMRGSGYTPPPASGTVFDDVPISHWAAAWIEQLYADGITSGCSASPPLYCPEIPVDRAQMAVFLERAMHWPTPYTPPPASGTVFDDVPISHWAAAWIEQLYADGITTGCSASPPLYCPEYSVSRAQMAVFLVRAFSLPMP